MFDQLAASIVASSLHQAPFERETVRLQLLTTTATMTYVPTDIGPLTLGQNPTGFARIQTPIEQDVTKYDRLVEGLARLLPIDHQADDELGEYLIDLQADESFEPLVLTHGDE